MSAVAGASRDFGTGPLARACALVYNLLVVELLFLLTAVPGLVALVLLDRDASNAPLVAACAVPLGPAFSAALYALHHRSHDLTDLAPGRAFWRGYRSNARPVLKLWLPWLAWLTIVAVNLAHFAAAGVPAWWGVLLVLVALVVTLGVANALVITSLFEFRTTDVARLALYFLVHRRGATIANLCLLVVAAGITLLSSEAVLALLGSVLAVGLLANSRSMVAIIRDQFTA
jgi:uncharacterized membrane protein YesL